jgi:hypothetical protein
MRNSIAITLDELRRLFISPPQQVAFLVLLFVSLGWFSAAVAIAIFHLTDALLEWSSNGNESPISSPTNRGTSC